MYVYCVCVCVMALCTQGKDENSRKERGKARDVTERDREQNYCVREKQR